MRRGTALLIVSVITILTIVSLLIACSDGASQTGFVNTSISDPAPCSTRTGPYSDVWVSVTDVQIHNSSTGQWMDLTKCMQPTQVSLLASANAECFLAMLVSKTSLQVGSYEQIPIILAATNANLE